MKALQVRKNSSRSVLPIVLVAIALPLVFASRLVNSKPASQPADGLTLSSPNESSRTDIVRRYGKLPLSFETNEGQADQQVKFRSRGLGYDLFLTSAGAVLTLRKPQSSLVDKLGGPESTKEASTASVQQASVLRLKMIGGNQLPQVSGEEELPGRVNYLIGDSSENWYTNVPSFARVRYQDIYPGVDLVFYGNQQQLEYDFIVAPRVSPRRIRMQFEGAQRITIDRGGDLVLSTAAGKIRQRRPVAYQEINGRRREVTVRYQLKGNKVGFALGAYDQTRPLVIDPVLIYSTFLGGGSAEQGLGIAMDSQGSAYITGGTISMDFPLANAYQNALGVGGGGDGRFAEDAFVVKLNPAGIGLVYSTYIGGNGSDIGNAIAVDSQGSAYVAGVTGSGSFPITPGAFQTSKGGFNDGFLTKLTPSGSSLSYSTFLGGDNTEAPLSVAVDNAGRAYVVGRTDSTRFNFIPLQRNGNPLYKSTDAAGSWAASSSGLTASSVSVITQDPVTPNTIYAGSTIGVFKSTDAASHWSLTGTARQGTAPLFTNAIVIDPSNPNIIYAGTSNGAYKSVDGGSLYDQKNTGLSVPFVFGLAIDPTTPTTLYAGTLFGMYKSTNGGDSWVSINNGTNSVRVNEVVLDPTNPAVIYIGTNSGMLKTINAGLSWIEINSNAFLNTSGQVTALAIDRLNPSTLYAGILGPADIVFKTTDGGATWTSSSTGMTYTAGGQTIPPAINTLTVDPVTSTNVYAATNGGGIYKSTNGGASWSQSNAPPNSIAGAVAVDRTNPATVYAGTAIGNDAFAARLDASGSMLEYLASFGGHENDEARGVALDSVGNAYIVGLTASPTFPVVNAFQPTLGAFSDAFVCKLNASGSGFVYSTFLGGNGIDQGRAIAVREGSAYVAGVTSSQNFPLANALKPTLANFDTDAFVTKLNTSGAGLDFSTYLGGGGADQASGVAVDSDGATYVTGSTSSFDFPTLDAPQALISFEPDAFATKLSPPGTSISYSTYLGGTDTDVGNGIAVDAAGNAYVVGTTSSSNFPTANSFQSNLKFIDAFVTRIGVQVDLSIAEIKAWTIGGRSYVYVKPQFANAGLRVVDWGQVVRSGNTFTVDANVEKLTGPTVQEVTTTAQIYDLGPLANETYNFNFKTSGALSRTLQFVVSSTALPPNPIDDARQFVKQQYRDFLNREADQAGEDFWTDNITKCGDPARRPVGQTEAQCTLRQRETTSAAFFLSPEFQYTGYYVYRMYVGALGRQPKLSEFIRDVQFVANGIVVNGQLSAAKINQNKSDFATQFQNCTDATKYRCAEFKAIYDGLNNTEYVDKLFETTGVNASATDRVDLVNSIGASQTRASVLQKVVDGINVIAEGNQQFTTTYGQAFYDQQFTRAFVQLEYFAYMKRDPDEAGYNFWLAKLNQFGGNFVNAEMVLAFISSPEYRARFGQP